MKWHYSATYVDHLVALQEQIEDQTLVMETNREVSCNSQPLGTGHTSKRQLKLTHKVLKLYNIDLSLYPTCYHLTSGFN
jgi:hypothetical protein